MRELHGLRKNAAYAVWCNMKTRCYNPNSTFYADYGGRGITVCQRWRESFTAFYADMGERPDGMTIERGDNDGAYEPGNCYWATRKAQSRNRRGRRYVSANGKTLSLAEWSDLNGVSIGTMWERLRLGWDAEKVVNTRVGGAGYGKKPKNATAASRDVDLHYMEHA